MKITLLLLVAVAFAAGQRITTIQLDGVQYFVSRMNPYSPELNYFLAYQYCRSLGLQLASFETKEKADTMTQYLKNAGYIKYDFWTSGNKLGTDMFLWMSTGLPFNATFDYMLRRPGNRPADVPPGTEPQRVARESGDSGSADGCVAMVAPTLAWEAQDCTLVKDFICEQTRCYYYNYGSIPVSATQGNRRPYLTTTSAPVSDDQVDEHEEDKATTGEEEDDRSAASFEEKPTPSEEEHHHQEDEEAEAEAEADVGAEAEAEEQVSSVAEKLPEDPVVSRLITTAVPASGKEPSAPSSPVLHSDHELSTDSELDDSSHSRPVHIPDIASIFTDSPATSQARKDSVFDGLETREILRSSSRSSPLASASASASASATDMRLEHRESADYSDLPSETESPNNGLEDAHTIGPYDTVQDYVNDQPELPQEGTLIKDQDDDSSTMLPEAEPAYRYNIKVRTNGKVLDPPSK